MDDEIKDDDVLEAEQGADIERLQNELDEVSEKLERAEFEKNLSIALTQEGVIDLDAALKLAEQGKEPAEVAAELKDCKPYLFNTAKQQSPGVTSGVKVSTGVSGRVSDKLNKVADTARSSGSRKDLCEYLKLRRTLLRKRRE